MCAAHCIVVKRERAMCAVNFNIIARAQLRKRGKQSRSRRATPFDKNHLHTLSVREKPRLTYQKHKGIYNTYLAHFQRDVREQQYVAKRES